jgi:energy-coupling factor transport system permease protein
MLLALVAILLLHLSAGIPPQNLIRIFKALLFVVALMVLLRALFYPAGDVWWEVGPIQLTTLGVAAGLVLGLRILAMAYAVFLWLYTTRTDEILIGLVHWGLPYAWGFALILALRFIPTLQRSLQSITQAQRARGLDLEKGSLAGRIRRWMPILVSMVIVSLRTSDQLASALEARGFGAPGVKRTYLRQIHFSLSDWILSALILSCTLALLWLHVAHGFGAQPLKWVL